MFSHYTYFDDLVEKMLRGDYDEHMREAWVWIHGRFVPYPFQNNIHRLPAGRLPRMCHGHHRSAEVSDRRATTSRSGSRRVRRGHRRALHAPLQLQGVGAPARDDGDHVAGRPGARRRRANGSCRTCSPTATTCQWGPNNKFKFPLLGTGMLYDRIAESLPKPVNLEHAVVDIDAAGKVVTFADGSTTGYDQLVTTMPLTELVKCIRDCPPTSSTAVGDSTTRLGCSSASASPSRARARSAGCTSRSRTRPSTESPTSRTTHPR